MFLTTHKIILLIDSRGFGGIETHVANLAKGLRQSGHKVNIVLLNNYGFHPVFDDDEFLRANLVKLDGRLKSLFQFIRNANADVIHTHGYKAGILGRTVSKLLFKNVVSTFHSGEKGSLKTQLYCWLDRLTASRTPCISVSKDISNSLSSTSEVIENFVNIPNRPYPLSCGNEIAFVGRFSYEKGPDNFIELTKAFPNDSFSMYGSGPMLEDIKTCCPKNVKLYGQVTSMECYWSKIKFLCITSREEGLPLVALEAMVMGVPVIAFDIGGLPDVIQNDVSGWLVPARRLDLFIEQLSSALKLDLHQYREVSTVSSKLVMDQFSTKSVIPRIFNVYSQAIAGGHHA